MTDYIKRDLGRIIANASESDIDAPTWDEQKKRLKAVQSADVAPVKHGYWIEYEPEHGRCSICGHEVDLMTPEDTHWCSNCGAKMDGESNE